MPTIDPAALTPRRWALLSASAVGCLGFGVLALLSLAGVGQEDLAGLYTFRSATVGDAILLPLLAYCLVRLAGLHRAWQTRERRVVRYAGAAGLLCGAALQAQWLLDPEPRLNWTLPAPHRFNIAGWYHAAFLVLACAGFAALAAAGFVRLRSMTGPGQHSSPQPLRSTVVLGALFATLGFAILLAEDNFPVRRFQPFAAAGVVGVLFISALTVATRGRKPKDALLIVLAAFAPAAALGMLFSPSSEIEAITLLPVIAAAFVGAFGSTVFRVDSPRILVPVTLLSALCAAGPVHAVSSKAHITVTDLAVAGVGTFALLALEVLVLSLLFADSAEPASRSMQIIVWALPVIAFGLAGRYFGQDEKSAAPHSNYVGVIIAFLLLLLTTRAARYRFDFVIKAEAADAPQDSISRLKQQAYLATSTIYVAVILASITFLIGTTPSDKWDSGEIEDYRNLVAATGALLVGSLLLYGAAILHNAALRTCVAVLIPTGWAAVMLAFLRPGYGNWMQLSFSVFIAAITGLFVAEGVISNAAYLQNLPIGRAGFAIAAASGLSSALTFTWMSGPAIQSSAGLAVTPSSLWALAVGACACVFLPFLAARVLPGADPPRQYTIGKPLAGVLQDGFIMTILAVSICWMPIFLLTHIPSGDVWLGSAMTYLALFSAAYVYVMRNNIRHVGRERKRVADRAAAQGVSVSNEEQKALNALARHIERQNRLAVFALFPLGFVLLVNEISGFDQEGFGQIMKVPSSP